jgi:hypothetical protein
METNYAYARNEIHVGDELAARLVRWCGRGLTSWSFLYPIRSPELLIFSPYIYTHTLFITFICVAVRFSYLLIW